MSYTIENAQWDDLAHTVLALNVLDNETGNRFFYAASHLDNAELNNILWALAMEDVENIMPSEVELILSGEKELPPGKTIIDMTIYDDEERISAVTRLANSRLAELTSPFAIAKAELDPEYKQIRLETLKALMEISKQPGYPYNVEWPEELL
jgi:hypothetical protein